MRVVEERVEKRMTERRMSEMGRMARRSRRRCGHQTRCKSSASVSNEWRVGSHLARLCPSRLLPAQQPLGPAKILLFVVVARALDVPPRPRAAPNLLVILVLVNTTIAALVRPVPRAVPFNGRRERVRHDQQAREERRVGSALTCIGSCCAARLAQLDRQGRVGRHRSTAKGSGEGEVCAATTPAGGSKTLGVESSESCEPAWQSSSAV